MMRAVAKTVLNRIQGVRARRSLRAAERAIAAGKIMLAAAKYAEAAARAQAETSLLRRVRKTAGKNLLKAGAPRDAMAHLYAVAEWSPEDADNLRRLTRAASQTDDAATEIFAWRALLKCEPENLKAHRRLAKLYYAHAPEMAAPHLEAVAAAASGWTENWRRLARVRSMTDDFGGEADAWRRVLENEPGDREAHERLAELVWDPKNAAAALPHLEALADAPSDNCEFWERLARARADAGDRAGEVAAWRRFLRASRYSFVAHRRIGALMMAKGAPDMAAPHLNAAAALAPGKESILEMRAEACRALNDCDGEIDALSKLTALKPHDAAVVQRLGALLMKD
ncbi:MAG: tetratricopeptide repeat protein, partial [Parvularculaceae bacterium]